MDPLSIFLITSGAIICVIIAKKIICNYLNKNKLNKNKTSKDWDYHKFDF